ncbi:unnamed protein product, partial [Rotaria sp. Silwood1]
PPITGNRGSYMHHYNQRDLVSTLLTWHCPRCTYLNDSSSRTCEMCSSDKGS